MVIEGSREYKAAQELERALNDYSWNPKKVCREYKVLSPYTTAGINENHSGDYPHGWQ